MPIFLAACGLLAPFIDRYEVAADLAATHGWTPRFVKTSNFTLARFSTSENPATAAKSKTK